MALVERQHGHAGGQAVQPALQPVLPRAGRQAAAAKDQFFERGRGDGALGLMLGQGLQHAGVGLGFGQL